jgi:superfamily II DNA/RNA helicase
MTNTFAELGVGAELTSALEKLSIIEPTPIQSAAFPLLMEGKDAYLQAETGTGKTLAYLLPIYSRLDPAAANAQVIIVAPTHELAIQIQRQCTDLSQFSGLPIRVLLLIGGTSRDRQLEKLKKKPHIIVGSSGRINELIADRKLKAQTVYTIVIDEADRLLAAESLADVRSIVASCHKNKNLVLVSATDSNKSTEAISQLAPSIVKVKTAATPINSLIQHLYLSCEARDKPDLVRKLIHAMKPERSLIFVHKQESAELLAFKLEHHKMKIADIHGAQHKEDRKRAMDDIRSGKINVLIASDVAARGLDIKGVSHVFNFDVPSDSGAYLHRIGRTGRAGAHGVAVSLVSGPELRLINRFEKDLGIMMQEVHLREGQVTPAEE